MERFHTVTDVAKQWNVPIRGYVSCVAGCPYEGSVPSTDVARIAERMLRLGCREISLGDTIGVGTPLDIAVMLQDVLHVVGKENAHMLAMHMHDTYGQALANILVALETGVRTIDASVSGLGGCPYAANTTGKKKKNSSDGGDATSPSSSSSSQGNVATEDVVYMLHGMGMETGIDLRKLLRASEYIGSRLQRPSKSKVGIAMMGRE